MAEFIDEKEIPHDVGGVERNGGYVYSYIEAKEEEKMNKNANIPEKDTKVVEIGLDLVKETLKWAQTDEDTSTTRDTIVKQFQDAFFELLHVSACPKHYHRIGIVTNKLQRIEE